MNPKRPDKNGTRLDAWLALTGRIRPSGGTVRLPLLSGSMAPGIPAGSILAIAVGPDRPVRPGDVAVFLADDRLVAHRVLLVLRAGPWHYVMEKGDANRRCRWRRADEIRGRVTGFSRPDGSAAGDPGVPALASEGLRRAAWDLLRRAPDPDAHTG